MRMDERRLDRILAEVTTGAPQCRVPGVVAMVTDRTETIYAGAAGLRSLDTADPMILDSVFALFSATKAVAGMAVLQCAEEGLLDLDAPARVYLPEIGDLQVLDGITPSGELLLRPPTTEITTRHLLLHTAGFAYDNFNETYAVLTRDLGYPPVASGAMAALRTPLLFDPGSRWEYGSGIDWAGLVVEAIRGQRLGQVLAERVFAPAGIVDMAFTRTPDMTSRTVAMHVRSDAGGLTSRSGFAFPDHPEVQMAGHGLYGSVGEFMKFIRLWLNDGAGPGGRALARPTVEMALRNGLPPGQRAGVLRGVLPKRSNDAEMFPGLPKSWAYSFMVNDRGAPTGRPAGAVGWAGLANLYYWIDRGTGLGGFWATQLLPFFDRVALDGFTAFETAVYDMAGMDTAVIPPR